MNRVSNVVALRVVAAAIILLFGVSRLQVIVTESSLLTGQNLYAIAGC